MSFDLRVLLPERKRTSCGLSDRERHVLAGICTQIEWILRRYADLRIAPLREVEEELSGPLIDVVVEIGGEECRVMLPDSLVLSAVAALVQSKSVDDGVLTALGFLVTEVLIDVRLRRPASLVDLRCHAGQVRCGMMVSVGESRAGILLSESLRKQLGWHSRLRQPERISLLDSVAVPCVPSVRVPWRDLVRLLSGHAVAIGSAAAGKMAAGSYAVDDVSFIFPEET